MTGEDPKAVLHRYLKIGRAALLWKLDGLSEYDVRRPLVPTGTNVLGTVKHLVAVEIGYFADTFARPFPEPPAWYLDREEYNVDMWAKADESPQQILEEYRRATEHADATIEALPLDAPGRVPWWPPERAEVTLQQILVHMIAETHRHAGQVDIVRELIDGFVGLREDNDNMAPGDVSFWREYHERLQRTAEQFRT